MRLDLEHEFAQRALDGPRVGALPAQSHRFFEELLIKHKICAFHAHGMPRVLDEIKRGSGSGRDSSQGQASPDAAISASRKPCCGGIGSS